MGSPGHRDNMLNPEYKYAGAWAAVRIGEEDGTGCFVLKLG